MYNNKHVGTNKSQLEQETLQNYQIESLFCIKFKQNWWFNVILSNAIQNLIGNFYAKYLKS